MTHWLHRHSLRAIVVPICVVTSTAAVAQERPAEQAFQNIDVLRGLPESAVDPLMQAFSRALGVPCTHCHVENRWEDGSKAPFAIARNMYRMVAELNANHLADREGIACWTCHGGSTTPARLPAERWQTLRDAWPAGAAGATDNLKLTMSVYSASLGVGCDHCHAPHDWTASSQPAHAMVARMNAMFTVFPRYMPETANTQCFMCHKGQRSPARAAPSPP